MEGNEVTQFRIDTESWSPWHVLVSELLKKLVLYLERFLLRSQSPSSFPSILKNERNLLMDLIKKLRTEHGSKKERKKNRFFYLFSCSVYKYCAILLGNNFRPFRGNLDLIFIISVNIWRLSANNGMKFIWLRNC